MRNIDLICSSDRYRCWGLVMNHQIARVFFLPWHNTRIEKIYLIVIVQEYFYCSATDSFFITVYMFIHGTIELCKLNLFCEFINHYMSVVCFYRDFACSYSDVVSFCHCVECMLLSLFSVLLSLYK